MVTHRFVLVSTSPRTGEVVYRRCKKSTNSIGEIKDMNENGWKYWFLTRNPRFLSSFCLQTAVNLDLFEPYLHHSRPLIGPVDVINNARGPNRLQFFGMSNLQLLPFGSMSFQVGIGWIFDLRCAISPWGDGETESLGCHCRLCLHRNTWFGGLVFQQTAETSKSIGCLVSPAWAKKNTGLFLQVLGMFFDTVPGLFFGGGLLHPNKIRISRLFPNQQESGVTQLSKSWCNPLLPFLANAELCQLALFVAEGVYCLGWLCASKMMFVQKKQRGLVTILRRRLLLRTKGGPKPVLNLSKKVFQGFPEV